MLNIVGHKKIWFTLSVILVGIAVASVVTFGFQESAELKGGALWEFTVPGQNLSVSDVQNELSNQLHIPDAQVNIDTDNNSFLVRFDNVDEATHQQYVTEVEAAWPSFQELSFQSISSTVGANVRNNAIVAIILVLIGISLYIAYAFRKASRPISSWKYGWITLLTLFHDVAIPAGMLAILGHFRNVQIDSDSIVALLVVMGFSVHDTIVVFDRIRENLLNHKGKMPVAQIVNDSVNQTLARSINTSLTLILVLLALYFIGPADLQYFVLTLLVGVTTGIYSSIFIASPLLVVISPTAEKV
jgi:preprotein translocase subunit SecF